MTTGLNQELVEKFISDKRLFIESTINVVNKDGELVPFLFNKPQQKYWNNRSKRDIILKASQLGFTSLIGAAFLVDCITTPGTVSVIVSHEEFFTQRLLARIKFYESQIPDALKVPLHHKSSYELSWPDINSVFYIGSARAYVFGRGERISNFHGSEIAFWDSPEKIMVPVLERANRVVVESTPFGEGTYYHGICQDALSGYSNWKMHFFPWWEGEDYYLLPDTELNIPDSDRKPELDLTAEEDALMRLHNLTHNQIRWRRMKIRDLKGDFWQEYPEDPETCFYSTDVMVFDKETLNILGRQCYKAPQTYNNWEIWYPPEQGGFYIIGADPTVGSKCEAGAVVWNFRNDKPIHCATLHGLYEPIPFAKKLEEGGKYYNNCLIAVESNNPGLATLAELNKVYKNLYWRHNLVLGKKKKELGWLTTESSKTFAVSEFSNIIKLDDLGEPCLITHDINLIKQARNLRYQNNKIDSIGESDILMAAMIGYAAKDTASSRSSGYKGSHGWNW